ncbi:MAG: hypothetical protein F6K41_07370 [Symploca sp. SIO3E6]|nr:hypothetical protein [Caldora sp. SIO3E6]
MRSLTVSVCGTGILPVAAIRKLYQIRYRYTRYAHIVETFHETSLQGFYGLLKTALL